MKKFNLGLEAIGFQDGSIFKEISDLFTTFKQTRDNNENVIQQIVKIIKNKIGINIQIFYDKQYATGVWLPTFNKNHIYFNNEVKQTMDITNSFDSVDKLGGFIKKNEIDIKKGKISGFFSEYQSPININPYDISALDGEELAAVFLHEVGHLFTYYENITKVTITNFVLMGLCQMAEAQDPIDKKKIFIKKLENNELIKPNTMNELVELNDVKTIATVFIDKIAKENASSSGSYFYDVTSVEQSADEFVSRLGGGRALVSALSKSKISDSGLNIQILNDIALNGLGIIGVAVASFVMPILGVLWGSLFMMITVYSSRNKGTASKDFTYDELKVRMKRIVNDLTERLKHEKDVKSIGIIVNEIETCNAIMDMYSDYKPLYARIADFIFKKHATSKDIYELQRDLEDIAMNKLFMKSKKLSLV